MRSWSLPFFIHRGRTKFLVAPVIAAVFVAIRSKAALTGCSLAFAWQAWCFVWLFVVPVGIYSIVLSVWPSPVFALYEDRIVFSSVLLPMKQMIIARSENQRVAKSKSTSISLNLSQESASRFFRRTSQVENQASESRNAVDLIGGPPNRVPKDRSQGFSPADSGRPTDWIY